MEAWFDTPQSIDVKVTDNSGAAFYPATPSQPFTFAAFTEADWDLEPAREDHPVSIGLVGDVTDTDPGATQTALAGTTGRWADAGHRHNIDTAAVGSGHGSESHSSATRSIFMPINDGVVADGGTLGIMGSNPNAVRTIALADAAIQGALFNFMVPDDWDSGDLSFQIYFAGATTTTGSVRWSVTHKVVALGDNVTAAGTATVYTSLEPTTANALVKDTLQSAVIASPAVGNFVMVNVRRLGTDGADNYAAVAHLIGLRIDYTAVQ